MSQSKYRPYLSLTQIKKIIDSNIFTSNEDMDLVRSLKLILLKSGTTFDSPQYVTSPRVSKFSPEGLGLTDSPTPKIDRKLARKEAYDRYLINPNANDLDAYNLYRYENDLMSGEEAAEYESKLF